NDEGQHLVIDGCTFSYNQAIGGSDAIGGSSGSGRIGHAEGGAVASGVATITNSTFDHNKALGGNNNTGGAGVFILGRGAGGAIGNFKFPGIPDVLTVSNCTF